MHCSKYIYSVLTLFLTLLCSCANELNTSESRLGTMIVSVSLPDELADTDPENVALHISSADGDFSHTWTDYKDLSAFEGFHAGSYILQAVYGTPGAQGYDCPCYIGEQMVTVEDNMQAIVHLDLLLSQAKVYTKADDTFYAAFPGASLVLHPRGYEYVNGDIGNDGALFVTPGQTSVSLSLTDELGRTVVLATDLNISTRAAASYEITVSMDSDMVSVACGDLTAELQVDSNVFATMAPVVTCRGFSDCQEVILTEGFPSEEPLCMDVTSDAPIRSLVLTSIGDDLGDIPSTCDVVSNPGALLSLGLEVKKESETAYTLDFSALVEKITVNGNSKMQFLVVATDIYGRESAVATLKVEIRSVELSVVSISPAVIGSEVASITLSYPVPEVEIGDFQVFIDFGHDVSGEPLEIVDRKIDDNPGEITLSFKVPQGITSVPVRIDYMGVAKLTATVDRAVPDYEIMVDAFATTVMVVVKAETPETTSAIVKFAGVKVNGQDLAVLGRYPDEGFLYCAGLSPDTRYTVASTLIAGQFAPTVNIRTEKAAQLPDADFEDVKTIIDYPDFPSGGVYSSTAFPIYNRQNRVNVDVSWPKKSWASNNEKTFCSEATEHNTWYMQPSAATDFTYFASGSKSIRISSVGWSLTGLPIEPYVQAQDSFLPYNPNCPVMDNVSAGYLFLGDYSFDADTNTEVFNEGINFSSRPSSLNGYFKFTPDVSNPWDKGVVRAKVVNVDASGNETVLAESSMEFSNAPDFRSFNLPFDYKVFFMPATKIKVEFCSSSLGVSGVLSDPWVPVSVDVVNSRFIGSQLWIDNLSLSY